MSWQHLNQPQGWIGVISLSLSLSLSSYDNENFGTTAFPFVRFNGPKARKFARFVMGNASKGLVRYRLNEIFWQNQTALVFFNVILKIC